VARQGSTVTALLVGALVVVGSVSLGLHYFDATTTTTTTTVAPTTTTTTAPPATTTTTVPVGDLPQTSALPPAVTASLTHRMRALLAAVASGDPAPGIAAFFPEGAYVQTKAGYGNQQDWHYRLIAHYSSDIAALHASLDPSGAPMKLLGYAIDDGAAVWVAPGVEGNKGPYWRVYNSTVAYGIGASRGYLNVTTMISWRGQWYVVHLTGYNS